MWGDHCLLLAEFPWQEQCLCGELVFKLDYSWYMPDLCSCFIFPHGIFTLWSVFLISYILPSLLPYPGLWVHSILFIHSLKIKCLLYAGYVTSWTATSNTGNFPFLPFECFFISSLLFFLTFLTLSIYCLHNLQLHWGFLMISPP